MKQQNRLQWVLNHTVLFLKIYQETNGASHKTDFMIYNIKERIQEIKLNNN